MQTRRGFTLIELLVVISIIALLSAVVLSSLNSARAKGRDALRITNLREVQKALSLYYSTNGSYPTTNGAWRGSDAGCYGGYGNNSIPGLVPTFIAKLPTESEISNIPNCFLYRSDGIDYKYLAHQTMESCTPGSCLLQDPSRMSQPSSSVYSDGGRAF